jgi:hypothetical protein
MVSIDLAVGRGARARAGPLTDISKEPAVVRSQGLIADRCRPLTRSRYPARTSDDRPDSAPTLFAMARNDWMHTLSLALTLALAVGAVCVLLFAM